jgi:hypothetical protein
MNLVVTQEADSRGACSWPVCWRGGEKSDRALAIDRRLEQRAPLLRDPVSIRAVFMIHMLKFSAQHRKDHCLIRLSKRIPVAVNSIYTPTYTRILTV